MTDAQTLTLALRGKWHRRYGVAPCPVCQPEQRRDQDALTLSDGSGGLLAHCKKLGCGFRDILSAAGVAPGSYSPPDPFLSGRRRAEELAEAQKGAAQALRLWTQAKPIGGTLAEGYLRGRGITCPAPGSLRFAPSCWHASARRFPALLGLVEGGEGFSLHRTYLKPDGSGKAEVEPQKAMLGSVAGGAVRLSGAPGKLVVAEGIETALSLLSGLLTDPATVWAALSTSGIRGLRLPLQPGRLTIATDSDDKGAGKAAGIALAQRAHALGWQVSLLAAPEGQDWNDVIHARGISA